MSKPRFLLTSLLSVLLLSGTYPLAAPSAASASEQPSAPNALAQDAHELLVQYKELPRSIASAPSLPAETEEIEDVAPAVQLLSFDTPEDLSKAEAELQRNPLVETVEPNYERAVDMTVNDPFYGQQWWVDHVQAPAIWPHAGSQSAPVTVAVIDSGIDSAIPDFAGRIAPGAYNFTDGTSDVQDVNGHGTAVSGVIAAALNDRYGITGIMGPYDVKILPLKTIKADGTGTVSMNVQAIDYAIRRGVDIINISQGGPAASVIEKDAIQRAEDAGILIVASAGNDAGKGNPVMYPAAYDKVLSVASVDQRNQHSSFSTYNDEVDLSAPGERIVTNAPGGRFVSMSGTSFSAPIAAGAAAMVQAEFPGLAPAETKKLLMESAKDLGAPGWDPLYGAGVLDLRKLAASLEAKPEKAKLIHVSAIELDRKTASLTVGNPATVSAIRLTARVLPETAADRTVTWSTSDPRVAAVDQTGQVTAVGKGKAVITATTTDGSFTAAAEISVVSIAPFTGDFPDMEIDQTKIFAVKFNTPLKRGIDYRGFIRISSDPEGTGAAAEAAVRIDPADPRLLYIAPLKEWKNGTSYLTIKKGLPADSGKTLNRDTKLKFTVR
ncbi:S8 family peptidase [Sporosarcina trichiuri]|uniref:S8 family peptidase n=1 Tax=Sporosarcina trichiuri TaxID=3056445 RepID=UPI0025B33711|nr:S8 family serine peptidase [Sporosarcina sp. 0.2-SM1T-5]WJY26269.1 S8 family serine peptidase [Sporosarcina sp. 0.2-SM1T-5]